jgi:hypothetical protein
MATTFSDMVPVLVLWKGIKSDTELYWVIPILKVKLREKT